MAVKAVPKEVRRRLLNRPYYAFLYARNVLKGRLPESLEVCFVQDPQSAFLYARDIVKGRLPDAVHNGLLMYSMERRDDGGFVGQYIKFLEGK
jgi:hypothetical protein